MRTFLYAMVLLASSCVSGSKVWQNAAPKYFAQIDFAAKDTVLDIYCKYLHLDAFVINQIDDIHYYLTCEPGYIPNTQRYINKELGQPNTFNDHATIVTMVPDKIDLPSLSVNKILIRHINWRYKHLSVVTAEWHRLLKPNGHLILEINGMPTGNKGTKRYPSVDAVIDFFTTRGFRMEKNIVFGAGEGKSTDFIFFFTK